jgi:hypothetical protein
MGGIVQRALFNAWITTVCWLVIIVMVQTIFLYGTRLLPILDHLPLQT